MPYTDEQLLNQVANGYSDAIDLLYQRYARRLYVFFRHSFGFSHPEDIVHDIFIKVIESARKFDAQKASFRTWLFRIARNYGIDVLRRNKILEFSSLDADPYPDENSKVSLKDALVDESRSVDDRVMESFILKSLRECIERLEKEEDRQAIVMYYLLDKVYREIGDIFGKSISMVKKRLFVAREKVKNCLEAKGVDSAF